MEKEKRSFKDNEARKRNISTSMKRRWRGIRHSQLKLNEEEEIKDYPERGNGLTIDFFEDEYIKQSNLLISYVLKILDIIPVRQKFGEIVRNHYGKKVKEKMQDNEDSKENKQGKRVVITPEQRDRIFDTVEGGTDEEN